MKKPFYGQPNKSGVALILVLAFVLLLTGIMVAFFTKSLANRNTSGSSVSQLQADVFARSASQMIIGDLKAEIIDGSKPVQVFGNFNYYEPDTNKSLIDRAIVPYRVSQADSSGVGFGNFTDTANTEYVNLLKRSAYGQPIYKGLSSRASSVSSLSPSFNNRYITPQRWNKPLLMEKVPGNANNDLDVTPRAFTQSNYVPGAKVDSGTSAAPDWILVTASGSNGISKTVLDKDNVLSGKDPIVGRYAYQIYHEGGTLDANVVGYPVAMDTTTGLMGRSNFKNNQTYADLTQIPGLSPAAIESLVNYKSYASLQQTNAFGETGSYSATKLKNFYQLNVTNAGFLTSNFQLLADPAATSKPKQSDHVFTSRQELIRFLTFGLVSTTDSPNAVRAGLQNALLYLGTFTRGLEQPSIIRAPLGEDRRPVLASLKGGNDLTGRDNEVNPNFLEMRVVKAFNRADGGAAIRDEPLVKTRFALNRLAWLTFKGPIADDNGNLSGDNDVLTIITALEAQGLTKQFLQRGGPTNIKNYFGLQWSNGVWKYDFHNNSGNGGAGSICTLKEVRDGTPHDPDFFELLKSTILVGSLGKAATNSSGSALPFGPYLSPDLPLNLRYRRDCSVDAQVIQIAANIIDQADVDGYPTRIVMDHGSGPLGVQTYTGVESLPYINYVFNGVIQTRAIAPPPQDINSEKETFTDAGEGILFQIPAVWNPHDPNGSLGNPRPKSFQLAADSAPPDGSGGVVTGSYIKIATYSARGDSDRSIDIDGGASLSAQSVSQQMVFDNLSGTKYFEPTLLCEPVSGDSLGTSIFPGPLPGVAITSFRGIKFGTFPLKFTKDRKFLTANQARVITKPLSSNRFFISYRVQYTDGGTPITYDTKYCRASNGRHFFQYREGNSVIDHKGNSNGEAMMWATAIDPRTSRFGMISSLYASDTDTNSGYPPPLTNAEGNPSSSIIGFVNAAAFEILTQRPDRQGGYVMWDFKGGDYKEREDIPFPKQEAGFQITNLQYQDKRRAFPVGMLQQNRTDIPYVTGRMSGDTNFPGRLGKSVNPVYYADPDGIVRRAAGAYVAADKPGGAAPLGSSDTTVGLPLGRIKGISNPPYIKTAKTADYNQAQSRPLLLNRPFRSVSELGYVFRDDPWRNLDLFTPETGDAGLLDVFTTAEAPSEALVAGKTSLNTRQKTVVSSILSKAYLDEVKMYTSAGISGPVGPLSSDAAVKFAEALLKRTSGATLGTGLLDNVSNLIGQRVIAQNGQIVAVPSTYDGGAEANDPLPFPDYRNGAVMFDGYSSDITTVLSGPGGMDANLKGNLNSIQRFREAPVRALTAVGQTRVWNLLIDVIAQTGRYPAQQTDMTKFVVEGEQRLWVHVAIDRLTGKVIDQSLEVVKE